MQQVQRRRPPTLLCLQGVASRCGGSHPEAKFQIEWCPSREMEALAKRSMCSPLEVACLLVI